MHLLCKMVAVIKIRNLKTKTKGKNMQIQRRKGTKNTSMMPPDPKVKKGRKGEKCTYCHKGFHPKSACMQKRIDKMAQILQQNNLGDRIPKGDKKKKPKDQNPKKGNYSHALIAINSSPDAWIVDSGAGIHKRSLLFIGCMQRSSYSNGGQLSNRDHRQRKN
jgi:hypothetical protein